MDTKVDTVNIENAASEPQLSRDVKARIIPMQEEAQDDRVHIHLTWRSWMVVFVSCFAYVACTSSVCRN
jgi:hypothetical protein